MREDKKHSKIIKYPTKKELNLLKYITIFKK